MALVVIVVTLGLKFFAKGMLSVAAVLIGLIVGYVFALVWGGQFRECRQGGRLRACPIRSTSGY